MTEESDPQGRMIYQRRVMDWVLILLWAMLGVLSGALLSFRDFR